jgi:hypothetical protein
LDDFGNRSFVSMLSQQDEGHRAPGVQKLREKFGGLGISGLMLEQHQSVVAALQDRLRFFQGSRMVEFRGHRCPVSVKNFPDEKKILFLASHQQDTQNRGRELGAG